MYNRFELLILFFYIGGELTNIIVLASSIQQNDSVIHIHVFILFQFFPPFGLLKAENSVQYSVDLDSGGNKPLARYVQQIDLY